MPAARYNNRGNCLDIRLLLAFITGLGITQLLPALPSPALLIITMLITALAAWQLSGQRQLLLLLLLALSGSGYTVYRAELRLAPELPADLIWRDVMVEGVVQGFPNVTDRRSRFDFQIKQLIAPRPMPLNVKARLTDYHHQDTPLSAIAEGNRLRLKLRLRPPDSYANPHGFDYAGYLLANDIGLTGYVRKRAEVQLITDNNNGLRRQLYERIRASQARQSALIAALVIGDRSNLSNEEWQVLRRTGTAHLVSVSGMHIGFIFLLAILLFGSLWRCSQRLTAFLPAPAAAVLIALPAAFAYALLSGFAIPVQRSFYMSLVAITALLLGGGSAIFVPLLCAMFAVVVIDPWAPLTAGFWLSFMLTGVVLAAVKSSSRKRMLLSLIHVQLLLSLAAIPITLWFFGEASFIAPLANLVAVPLVAFAALPLSLAGIAAGDWCWLPAGWILDIMWHYLHWLAQLPYAALTPAQPPLWLFLLALAGVIWLLLPRGVPWRTAGLLPVIAMLLWQPPVSADGTFKMTVLDVGQGTAVVLQTQRHIVVYDTGRALGGIIIADYLRGEGISRINRLIISHDDYDHRGGMDILLSALPADTIISSESATPCRAGTTWRYDNVTFRFLHPHNPAFPDLPPLDENDSSCVLLVESAGGQRALLTGDISSAVEPHIATPADVLLVAHHGSRHSTASDFLSTVNADAAVISVGRNNYQHPHQQTLTRLKNSGAAIYRTDKDGAVILTLADTVTVERWRNKYKRYWRK